MRKHIHTNMYRLSRPIHYRFIQCSLLLHSAFTPAYHLCSYLQLKSEFRQRNGDGLGIAPGSNRQVSFVDNISLGKAIHLPVLICVSFILGSVTKLYYLMIHQCM